MAVITKGLTVPSISFHWVKRRKFGTAMVWAGSRKDSIRMPIHSSFPGKLYRAKP